MNQAIPKERVPEGMIMSERKAIVDNSFALNPDGKRSPPKSVAKLRLYKGHNI